MLKKPANGVLALLRPSTYPRGYASALHSLRPCWTVILNILRDIHLRFHICSSSILRKSTIVLPQPA